MLITYLNLTWIARSSVRKCRREWKRRIDLYAYLRQKVVQFIYVWILIFFAGEQTGTEEPFNSTATATKNRKLFDGKLIPMPENVSAILYHSSTSVHFIREAVSASREVLSTAVPLIIDALIHVAYSSTSFSDLLLAELLKQYHSVSSGELKNLSSLLVDVLVSPPTFS